MKEKCPGCKFRLPAEKPVPRVDEDGKTLYQYGKCMAAYEPGDVEINPCVIPEREDSCPVVKLFSPAVSDYQDQITSGN